MTKASKRRSNPAGWKCSEQGSPGQPDTWRASDQQAQVMVCVLTGPRKKNRPGVQALTGTIIDTSTLWPGASTPPDGLKTICPGTFVKAVQFRLLVAVDLSATFARQVYRSEERRVGKECRSRWS